MLPWLQAFLTLAFARLSHLRPPCCQQACAEHNQDRRQAKRNSQRQRDRQAADLRGKSVDTVIEVSDAVATRQEGCLEPDSFGRLCDGAIHNTEGTRDGRELLSVTRAGFRLFSISTASSDCVLHKPPPTCQHVVHVLI